MGMIELILYSKPGCHLCEGLQEKLAQVTHPIISQLEVRDITTRDDWFQAYQYEIPVLCCRTQEGGEKVLPRLSPRAPVNKLEALLSQSLESMS
ncbi:MAG: glutaredoxin family protein [Prochlorotrichaceae cyanobacterium]